MNYRTIGVILLFLFRQEQAHAIDPSRAVGQYLRQQWQVESGSTAIRINAIAQTPDGYLWVGTDENLLRFDGFRFEEIQPHSEGLAPIRHVLNLIVDSGGALWVRTEDSRVLRYKNGSFKSLLSPEQGESTVTAIGKPLGEGIFASGLSYGLVQVTEKGIQQIHRNAESLTLAIVQTTDDLWLGTRENGLLNWSHNTLNVMNQGIPDLKVNSLLATSSSQLWIGTDGGLAHWDGHKTVSDVLPAEMNSLQILTIVQDRDGNLWIGSSRGLIRYNSRGAQWMPRDARDRGTAVTAVFEDREGNLWFGSGGNLERLRDSPLTTYGNPEEAAGDQYGPVYADSRGRTWFAPLTGGLYWMRDGITHPVVTAGLDKDIVYSIDGRGDEIWLGRQRGGLTRLDAVGDIIKAKTWTTANGLAENSVYAVHLNRDGSLWMGTLTSGASHFQGGKFHPFDVGNGLISNTVAAIEEGSDGTMWFATPRGLSALHGLAVKSYGTTDGLASSDVVSLLADPQGGVWVGTTGGFSFADKGQIRRIDVPLRSPETVVGIALDRQGLLWLATTMRVLSVRRSALLQLPLVAGAFRSYGMQDGIHSTEGVRRNRSVVADVAGNIWITTNRGLSASSPSVSRPSPIAIPQVEGVMSDGVALPTSGEVRIPAGAHRLTFNYAGLDLRSPERVRFRYRLDGFDKKWSPPMEGREAVYTNLVPGKYKFRVVAANMDGQWNPVESAVSLYVQPLLWQRWEFEIACVGILLLMAVWIYRARMRYLIVQANMRFEERLIERTRIARELHDTLLQGFISASLHLHVTAESMPPQSPIQGSLQTVLQMMEKVIEEGRNAVKGLRTFHGTRRGLEQMFRELISELGAEDAAGYSVVVEGELRSLRAAVYEEVWRIGREAVINAWRHSQARQITVRFEYSSARLTLSVIDDGRGMDAAMIHRGRPEHWGLQGMRERAARMGARLHIESRPGQGTRVVLTIPAAIAFHDDMRDRKLASTGLGRM
ncbi:sensor histidine kinase [Terriglobus saanensis]|uniref:sensor histidine kinase n=1 Tax=Terriglobus saanensis TaxID=870903 RepID=UPI0002E5CDAC|nr:sensor histidine kinase [Terriglobus saanensis]